MIKIRHFIFGHGNGPFKKVKARYPWTLTKLYDQCKKCLMITPTTGIHIPLGWIEETD